MYWKWLWGWIWGWVVKKLSTLILERDFERKNSFYPKWFKYLFCIYKWKWCWKYEIRWILIWMVEFDMYYHSPWNLESLSILEVLYLFRNIYFGLLVKNSYDCCRNCMRIRWIETNFSSMCIEHCCSLIHCKCM